MGSESLDYRSVKAWRHKLRLNLKKITGFTGAHPRIHWGKADNSNRDRNLQTYKKSQAQGTNLFTSAAETSKPLISIRCCPKDSNGNRNLKISKALLKSSVGSNAL